MTEIECNHTSEGSTPSEVPEPDMTKFRPTSDFIIEPPTSDPASPEELATFFQVPITEVYQYIRSGNLRLTMKLEEPDAQLIALDDIWAYIHNTKHKEGECTIDPGSEPYCELGYHIQAKHRLKHGEPKFELLTPFE